jgi:hypothetical protein
MMTDQERQHIRHRAEALCRSASMLCTHVQAQCTLLQGHRVQLAARRGRLQASVCQQRRIRGAGCLRQGRLRDPAIGALTTILSRLRRPYPYSVI